MKSKCRLAIVLCVTLLAMPVMSLGESRIDKIKRTKKLDAGAREGIPPFGFYDEKGQWVGWCMDLTRALHKVIVKKLGMDIELVFKPVTPQTRIPLIVNGTLDLVLESATQSVDREGPVDFSLPNKASLGSVLMRKGTPIINFKDLAGKRAGVTAGSTYERFLVEQGKKGLINPPPVVVTFNEDAASFLAMQQGKIDVHVTSDLYNYGLRAKVPRPEEWEVKVFAEELGFQTQGIILPKNDSDWRDMVNHSQCYLIRTGEYKKIWDDWFGPKNPKAGYAYPITEPFKTLVYWQCWDDTKDFIK